MSFQRPAVLYVGSPDTGAWLQGLVTPQDGYIYQPSDLLEALAMYVNYYPDVIILDARWDSSLAERLYFHLNSVDTAPILILDSAPEHWPILDSHSIRVVSDEGTLCDALHDVLLAGAEQCQIVTPSYR
ncbi:MAG: hypothetical protein ACYDBJ_18625 [Aggregatilineales bacterium]